jgi:tyrosyl-tRNA synthetase
MSKSKPETAIYVHDTEEDIKRKVMKSFCPPNSTKFVPVFETIKHLILRNSSLEINGKEYPEFEPLEQVYLKGEIHPKDLKEAVAERLIELLDPIRKHFREGSGKKYLEELIELKRN